MQHDWLAGFDVFDLQQGFGGFDQAVVQQLFFKFRCQGNRVLFPTANQVSGIVAIDLGRTFATSLFQIRVCFVLRRVRNGFDVCRNPNDRIRLREIDISFTTFVMDKRMTSREQRRVILEPFDLLKQLLVVIESGVKTSWMTSKILTLKSAQRNAKMMR